MSGVVVEVRVKEGQEILKGDPVCGKPSLIRIMSIINNLLSAKRNEGKSPLQSD
jgi:biotin carboxyl carrier protein